MKTKKTAERVQAEETAAAAVRAWVRRERDLARILINTGYFSLQANRGAKRARDAQRRAMDALEALRPGKSLTVDGYVYRAVNSRDQIVVERKGG